MDVKKILIIDKDTIRTETRAVLLNQVRHHDVRIVDTIETARTALDTTRFDMIVIDLVYDWTASLLDEILKNDPEQPVVALSEELQSCIPAGCGFCQENHRMRLMVEPFPIQTFFAYVDDFDFHPCVHTNLQTALSDRR